MLSFLNGHSLMNLMDARGMDLSQQAIQTLTAEIAGCSLDTTALEEGCARVEQLAALLLLRGFHDAGVFLREGETATVPSLEDRLGVQPEYQPLFGVLLAILARHGYVSLEGTSVRALAVHDTSADECEKVRGGTVEAFPDREILVRLVETSAPNAVAVVSGRKKAVEVLFPGGSAALVEDVYADDAVSLFFNHLSTHAMVECVSQRLQGNGNISILEIGAGTGGTSAPVLKALDPMAERVSYDYTDLSQALLHGAESKFERYRGFVRFRPLDIEREPQPQGFGLGAYDIVLAANVLHATRDIGRTLHNVQALLRPGGTLILNEVTRVFDFTTLTFGLMPGWWLFEDASMRLPASPLLSADGWKTAMEASGFSEFHCFSPFDAGLQSQCLMISTNTASAADTSADRTVRSATVADREQSLRALQKSALEKIPDNAQARQIVNRQLDILQKQIELLRRR